MTSLIPKPSFGRYCWVLRLLTYILLFLFFHPKHVTTFLPTSLILKRERCMWPGRLNNFITIKFLGWWSRIPELVDNPMNTITYLPKSGPWIFTAHTMNVYVVKTNFQKIPQKSWFNLLSYGIFNLDVELWEEVLRSQAAYTLFFILRKNLYLAIQSTNKKREDDFQLWSTL